MIRSNAIAVAPLDKDSHPVKNVKIYNKYDHDLSEFIVMMNLRRICYAWLHYIRIGAHYCWVFSTSFYICALQEK